MKETRYMKDLIEFQQSPWPFDILNKAFEMGRAACLEEVTLSGLVGRGGAGFPTGRKWAMVMDANDVCLICNADEGEPGTFKDRYIMESNGSLLLESLLITAYILNAKSVFIYIRGEYALALKSVKNAIEQGSGIMARYKEKTGIDLQIQIVKGQGAYVCGDETSLINSIEGKRPNSRIKPPYPTQSGLYGLPTVVNNVETLCNVPFIIRDGGESYKHRGVEGSRGTKLVCLSGRVNNPGVFEIEMGKITLRELIWELGGGIRHGGNFKFLIPGGISTPLLTEEALDTPIDYQSLSRAGSSLGSGAIIVADQTVSIVETASNVADFYMRETCGICFPCKEGNRQIRHLLKKICAGQGQEAYLQLINDISTTTTRAARCGLGQSAGNFVDSSMVKFKAEYLSCIHGTPTVAPVAAPEEDRVGAPAGEARL